VEGFTYASSLSQLLSSLSETLTNVCADGIWGFESDWLFLFLSAW